MRAAFVKMSRLISLFDFVCPHLLLCVCMLSSIGIIWRIEPWLFCSFFILLSSLFLVAIAYAVHGFGAPDPQALSVYGARFTEMALQFKLNLALIP